MGGTRADLRRLMGPYIVDAALRLRSPVTITEHDYGFTLSAAFGDRVIIASVHHWDADYALMAFDRALSATGAGGVTWLTPDKGREAPWAHDPQAQG